MCMYMKPTFVGNPLLPLFCWNYSVPTDVGLCGCQTVANLSDMVNRGLDFMFAIGHNVCTFYWCHKDRISCQVIILTSDYPHGLKVRGLGSFLCTSLHP